MKIEKDIDLNVDDIKIEDETTLPIEDSTYEIPSEDASSTTIIDEDDIKIGDKKAPIIMLFGPPTSGKSSPTEILNTLASVNAEGRPIWKPMHMQPIYHMNGFVTREGDGRAKTNAYISGGEVGKDGRPLDVGQDIFQRGLCLPSDNKMTSEQQDMIIEMVKSCF